MFTFGGESSDAHGVVVQKRPDLCRGEKIVQTVHIPGRNGDILYPGSSYANYIQPYEVYIHNRGASLSDAAADVARWLYFPGASIFAVDGYARLEDSYEPDIYRMAQLISLGEMQSIGNRFISTVLQFDCQPQRWLKSGDRIIETQENITLWNDCMPALPIITVYAKQYGEGSGSLQIGGRTVEIRRFSDMAVRLDSETQTAFYGGGYLNMDINAPYGYPVLDHGENRISFTGDISKIEITPRWWTL